MSLNGLDNPKVREAHEVAAAEPGGWFLLKYAARDEVELLGQGNGGIVEVRNAVADYDETSPLYGFLRYRRRNVLIKYLPENCSRLIQARVAVHFNAICELFSPYDTIFEITEAKELKDTKLSAACSLHAASGSSSSSTSSLRRRRLVEIAEEEEEEQRANKRQSIVNEDAERPISPTAPVTLNSELAASPEQSKFTAGETSEVPNFVGADERPLSPVDSIDAARRMSSQSGHNDMFAYSSYPYGKPKVKLAPRPSLDANGRPRTPGSYRPVSQIPAGFKFFGKGSKKGKGKEEGETGSTLDDISLAASIPIPEESQHLEAELARPATSSGVSTKSTIMPAPPAKPTISPEKARLMKAMKLREKRMMDAQSSPASGDAATLDMDIEDISEEKDEVVPDQERRPSISNADSAIVLDASCSSMHTDQASEATRTDSHPSSPVIASSEPDHSTKASSLSDSTDETVQDKSEISHEQPGVISDVPRKLQEALPVIPKAAQVQQKTTTAVVGSEAADQKVNSGGISAKLAGNVTKRVDEPSTPTSPRLKIPKSKFSTQDLRSAAKSTSPPATGSLDKQTVSEEPSAQGKDKASVTNADADDQLTKRKILMEPLRTDLTQSRRASRADGNQTDDDQLLEEIHSATVEEAKSMSVAKSPVTPVFPSPTKSRPTTSNGVPQILRTASNPVRGTLAVPPDSSSNPTRSASGGSGFLSPSAQQAAANPNKKANLNTGSSISQRIKALEKLSGGVGEPGAGPISRDRPSSAFFSVKKSREPSRSPSVIDRSQLSSRHGQTQSPPSGSQSQEESPEASKHPRRERSGSVASRLSMFEASPGEIQPQPSGHAQRGRPESISVTAKIIRDPNQSMQQTLEPPKDPSEYNHLELKQSPLLVDHQRGAPNAKTESPKETLLERRMSKDLQSSGSPDVIKDDNGRRSSLGIMKDFISKSVSPTSNETLTAPPSSGSSRSPTRPSSTQQNASFGRRLSISSRRSSFSRDNAMSPSAATEGSASGDETKSNSDKKQSRAGRFMRRLSNLSSGSRGKITSPGIAPTVTEEEAPRPATTNSAPSIVSYMGDVNVQFPDTLLWKRRNLCLDSQGFMILSALPAQSGRAAQGTKRYHLSEFRQPYIPDVEVQELPNSVVLDFVEGSGIQVACEDRAGQTNVLQTLRDAHANHPSGFGM